MFFGYIIRSESRDLCYIGHSDNVDRRLIEHNTGQSKFTRGKGPWKLAFVKQFSTRSEAVKWESKLKARKSKKVIQDLVKMWGSKSVG
jgi:putative endonuclease